MTEPQVVTNFKTRPVAGPCGCQRDTCTPGPYRSKPNRDTTFHVKACACPSCRGRRNRRLGANGQRQAMRALGVPVGSLSPGHEEHAPGLIRLEAKSGAQAKPVATAYLRCEVQSEASRPIGDGRPFVACFEPQGWSDGLVVVRRSKLAEVVAALAVQLGMVQE